MSVTRIAARTCFLLLLAAAGAAALAAKPMAREGAMVQVVAGDPCLDLQWALMQSGMAQPDAHRVSVMLVDEVDPDAELQALSVSWSAEIWWRDESAGGPALLHMMRVRIPFQCGATLSHMERSSGTCPDHSRAFLQMRVTSDRLPPIPPGTPVLVRIGEPRYRGARGSLECEDLVPLGGEFRSADSLVSCLEVRLDPDTGIEAPGDWSGPR